MVDETAKPIGKAEGEAAVSLAEFVRLLENSGDLGRFEEAIGHGSRVGEIRSALRLSNAYSHGKARYRPQRRRDHQEHRSAYGHPASATRRTRTPFGGR